MNVTTKTFRVPTLLFFVFLAVISPAHAQNYPRDRYEHEDPPPYEVYAQGSAIGNGAMNGNFTKFLGPAPGFRVGAAVNSAYRLGLVGDFGYYRFSDHTGRASLATLMIGPRVFTPERFRSSWFLQGLVGGARWSVDSVPQKFTHRKLIASLGGGLNIRLTDHLALRPFEMEFVLANTRSQTLDARFSSGFVIRFGERK